MFYQHRFSSVFVKNTSVRLTVTLLLLITVSSIVTAKEPYPSTLDDYVTLYQIKSYELFRHDSAEYEQRLKRGREAIRRMKKHGGRSAEAATKHWFETAVYSKDTADELPGLPPVAYLKDVDPSMVAKKDATTEAEANTPATSSEQSPSPTEEKTVPSPIAVSEPHVEPSVQGSIESNGLAAAVASLKKVMTSSTETEAQTQIFANVESANIDDAKGALSATTNVFQGLASTVFGSIESVGTNDDETTLEVEESDAEPFPDMQPASPFDEFARSESAEQAIEQELSDSQSVTVDVNARIAGYNAALTAVHGEVLVALGGNGSELNAVVEKIESLAETRSGIKAQIDLTSQSTQAVQAAADLEPIVKELHKGIFKFPKSPDGLPFKNAVNMLERLEDVELQLKELYAK